MTMRATKAHSKGRGTLELQGRGRFLMKCAAQIKRIEGFKLALRLIQSCDADYVHRLRTDPSLNTHLSEVRGSVLQQKDWIESYKQREIAGSEYYYIIERLSDALPCGVVRLYNIKGSYFTWGSWILDQNKPQKAALESAVLIYELGFDFIGCELAVFEVRKDNIHTINFHRRFGAKEVGLDDTNVYFQYSKSSFDEFGRQHFRNVLSVA